MTFCINGEQTRTDSHLQPLSAQVGGHENMKIFNNKFVCKSLNQREYKFYQAIPPELKNLVPRFVGTLVVDKNQRTEYLVLENLTDCFKKPCVLDLKMGTRMYSDFASETKMQSQERKSLKTTSSKLGVRFCGSQRFSNIKDTFEKIDKYVGRKAGLLEFSNLVKNFFTIGGILCRNVIKDVIIEIKLMRKVLVTLDQLRLYSSSLLIVYEGLSQTDTKHASSDYYEQSIKREAVSKKKSLVKVKIIDFANAALPEDDIVHDGPDQGFLLGLKNIQKILEVLLLGEEELE